MKLMVVQSWIGDWEAYDEDGLSGICGDPDCGCRRQFIRGTGETPEEAIQEFVNALLDKYGIELTKEVMKCDYPACGNKREIGELYCIMHNRKYTSMPKREV